MKTPSIKQINATHDHTLVEFYIISIALYSRLYSFVQGVEFSLEMAA